MKPLTDGERMLFVARVSAALDVGIDPDEAVITAKDDLLRLRGLVGQMAGDADAMLREMLGEGAGWVSLSDLEDAASELTDDPRRGSFSDGVLALFGAMVNTEPSTYRPTCHGTGQESKPRALEKLRSLPAMPDGLLVATGQPDESEES